MNHITIHGTGIFGASEGTLDALRRAVELPHLDNNELIRQLAITLDHEEFAVLEMETVLPRAGCAEVRRRRWALVMRADGRLAAGPELEPLELPECPGESTLPAKPLVRLSAVATDGCQANIATIQPGQRRQ